MFAFTPLKILLLVALIGIVWYGAKILKRRDEIAEELRARMKRGPSPAAEPKTTQNQAIDDLTACPRCGTYLVPRQAKRCERADCPYPG